LLAACGDNILAGDDEPNIDASLIDTGTPIDMMVDPDAGTRRTLAGGHLRAQIARFESFWRVHVVIDRRIWGVDERRPSRLPKEGSKYLRATEGRLGSAH
jgi:hypothetical protein